MKLTCKTEYKPRRKVLKYCYGVYGKLEGKYLVGKTPITDFMGPELYFIKEKKFELTVEKNWGKFLV